MTWEFREWVSRIIETIDPSDRRDLARDPKGAVVRRFGLQLQETEAPPPRGDGGWCDGMSFAQGSLVLYKPSAYSKREHFTILHELAHLVVRRFKPFMVWVANRADTKQYIEQVCNAVAADLLVPPAFVEGVLGGQKPSARHFLTLVQRSAGSREVCAIAIAPYLGCYGFAAVLSLNQGKVTFASPVVGTRPYPRRDDALPAGHPLHRLGPTGPVTAVGWWPHGDGQPETYYVDAVAEERFGYALFAVDDLWGATSLHVTDPVPTRSYGGPFRFSCSCGHRGETHEFPCVECHTARCTKCKMCRCERQRRNHVQCRGCKVSDAPAALVGGYCVVCRSRGKHT